MRDLKEGRENYRKGGDELKGQKRFWPRLIELLRRRRDVDIRFVGILDLTLTTRRLLIARIGTSILKSVALTSGNKGHSDRK